MIKFECDICKNLIDEFFSVEYRNRKVFGAHNKADVCMDCMKKLSKKPKLLMQRIKNE